jgi:hypothetical protein
MPGNDKVAIFNFIDSKEEHIDEIEYNLSEWQKEFGYDENSQIVEPSRLFVNYSLNDFHYKNDSPAINKGIGEFSSDMIRFFS